jgi:hypothetical protein
MSDLKTPLLAGAAVLLFGGVVFLGKKSSADTAVRGLEGRIEILEHRLADVRKSATETAAVHSRLGPKDAIDKQRSALLAKALPKRDVDALAERLRAVARRCAHGPFDSTAAVRISVPGTLTSSLARVEIQVDVTTDWPHLGVLLAEVRALAPRAVLEEATVRRAEAVPYLGVRLTLVTLVSDSGTALDVAAPPEDPLEGKSPFFTQGELATGRSRRSAAPWTPPRTEVSGIVYAKGASRAIVNDEPVAEGASFAVGSEIVKVVAIEPLSVRFQSGDTVFERELPPLSRGGGK